MDNNLNNIRIFILFLGLVPGYFSVQRVQPDPEKQTLPFQLTLALTWRSGFERLMLSF
jgi:hypothetical protein